MSEHVDLNNLEDDTPAPVAETPPAPPETPPAEPAAPPPDGEDLNAVDIKDEGRVKGIIGELSRMREQNRTLKTQAEKAAQLEAQLAEMKPYAEFVKANPQLLQPRPPEPEPKPAAPSVDPDAEEAARIMDFYKTDGSLDLEKGARWLALQDKRAGRTAQQAMQPLVQQSTQERVNANYVTFKSWAQQQQIKPEVADGIWGATMREPGGMQTLADPASVRALALLALGANTMATPKQPPAPSQPPVVTEASGGRLAAQVGRLDPFEEKMAKHRGLSATKWQELTKNFKPGQTMTLEDD